MYMCVYIYIYMLVLVVLFFFYREGPLGSQNVTLPIYIYTYIDIYI